MQTANTSRILIADQDKVFAQNLADFLQQHGFTCRLALNEQMVRDEIVLWRPQFIFLADTLPPQGGLDILKFVQSMGYLHNDKLQVVITSPTANEQDIHSFVSAGAKAVMKKPIVQEDALTRLLFYSQNEKSIEAFMQEQKVQKKNGNQENLESEISQYLNLIQLALQQPQSSQNPAESLYELTRLLRKGVLALRTSVVQVHSSRQATVLASSDDPAFTGIQVELERYPEIQHVMNTLKPLALEKINKLQNSTKIEGEKNGVSFNSMIVVPLFLNKKPFGVLTSRMAQAHAGLKDQDVVLSLIFAQIIGQILDAKSEQLIKTNAA